MKKSSNQTLLPISEATCQYGIASSRIRAAIKNGILKAVKAGHGRLIHRANLERWIDAGAMKGGEKNVIKNS